MESYADFIKVCFNFVCFNFVRLVCIYVFFQMDLVSLLFYIFYINNKKKYIENKNENSNSNYNQSSIINLGLICFVLKASFSLSLVNSPITSITLSFNSKR